MGGGHDGGVGGQEAEHGVSEKGIDENEYYGDAHAPAECVVNREADHTWPAHPDESSGEGLTGEGEAVCEVREEKEELKHYGARGKEGVAETGGDGHIRQIDDDQADGSDKQIPVDGEKSPDLIFREDFAEAQATTPWHLPTLSPDDRFIL